MAEFVSTSYHFFNNDKLTYTCGNLVLNIFFLVYVLCAILSSANVLAI